MSRDTFYNQEPAKYYQSEDLPAKSKRVTHLVTYSNFLSSNDDHSLDRPFTNCSPNGKKKSFQSNQVYPSKDYEPPYCDIKPDRKKITITQGHHALSTINPIKFDPSDKGPEERAEIRRSPERNRSNLSIASAQPTVLEPFRTSKRVNSGKYTDSSNMRLTLSYNG